jgi:sporulation protein YlmC with PRC-barrel domain
MMHQVQQTVKVLSASTIIGDEVKNRAGEHLGNVEEIMFDINSGHIAYAVLSFGGFMGLGDKYFAIPWAALSVDTEAHALILDVDKETLQNAPGFDKDNWPQTVNGNSDWLAEVYDHYGYTPYWS